MLSYSIKQASQFGDSFKFRRCNIQLDVWRSHCVWPPRTWPLWLEWVFGGNAQCWKITPQDPSLASWTPEVIGTLLPRSLRRLSEVKPGSVFKRFHLLLYCKLNSAIKQPGLDIHKHVRPLSLQLPITGTGQCLLRGSGIKSPLLIEFFRKMWERWLGKRTFPRRCLEKASQCRLKPCPAWPAAFKCRGCCELTHCWIITLGTNMACWKSILLDQCVCSESHSANSGVY